MAHYLIINGESTREPWPAGVFAYAIDPDTLGAVRYILDCVAGNLEELDDMSMADLEVMAVETLAMLPNPPEGKDG